MRHNTNLKNYLSMDAHTFSQIREKDQNINKNRVNKILLDASILHLTNEYRKSQGVHPLHFHPALRASSNLHTLEMVENNFFDHINPYSTKYKTMDQRISATAVKFSVFGENLANVPTVNHVMTMGFITVPHPKRITYLDMAKKVVNGWILSEGHRLNLINKDFIYEGSYSEPFFNENLLYIMTTQNFGGNILNV